MSDYIKNRTEQEQSKVLASYLPNNQLWANKNSNGSNIKKTLDGLTSEYTVLRGIINNIAHEYFPSTTINFIEEWERQVNIPDDCIPVATTLEERKKFIDLKLSGINATTKKEFETLISKIGISASVDTGVDTSTLPLNLPFLLISEAEAPFIIVVTLDSSLAPSGLPLELPFTLSAEAPNILACLLDRLIPAHCEIIFRYS